MRTKRNPTQRAAFNLRETGPMTPADASKRLGGADFRLATELGDRWATLDRDPCPRCAAAVEWAPTSAKVGSQVVRYLYARCQKHKEHAWGFRGISQVERTPPSPPVNLHPVPPTVQPVPVPMQPALLPTASQGPAVMQAWIEGQLRMLYAEADKLKKIQDIIGAIPGPALSPNGHRR